VPVILMQLFAANVDFVHVGVVVGVVVVGDSDRSICKSVAACDASSVSKVSPGASDWTPSTEERNRGCSRQK